MKPIRVMVVDDHFVVRVGLKALIDAEADMTVVGEAGSGEKAVALFAQQQPDVTLMDLRLPLMSGVEATRAIRSLAPDARVVVLTTYDGDEDIHRALSAGARAYLLKGAGREELLEVIRAVHRGQRRIPAAIGARLAEAMPRSELTRRELEVLSCVVEGLTNRQIGERLSITEGTVKVHVNRILGKMGVQDRTQAATTALRRGIVQLE
jgi:two-component system NarL family response regulator